MTADAFLNGLGIFETLRVNGAKAIFPSEHYQRLKSSAEWLNIPYPSYALFSQACISEQDSAVRFNIVATGGAWSGDIQGWEFNTLKRPFKHNQTPLQMDQCPIKFAYQDVWRTHKTFSRGPLQWCLRQAQAQALDDALLWDTRDQLLESTIGNVFFQIENQWFTPPLSLGILPGILRHKILSSGLAKERILKRSEMKLVQAMVRTNSVQGFQVVQSVASQKLNVQAAKTWIEFHPAMAWSNLLV